MADPGFETKVPFVAEISAGKTWGDCEVVWEGLRPDGLTEEDEEALAIGGAAPRFESTPGSPSLPELSIGWIAARSWV